MLFPMNTSPSAAARLHMYIVVGINPDAEDDFVRLHLRATDELDAARLARMELAKTKTDHWHLEIRTCAFCVEIEKAGGFGPSHEGRSTCRSGSLVSGGRNAHCTCDTCF
jgi:hypothetical protein